MADTETATITDSDVGDSADSILLGTRIRTDLNERLTEAADRMNISKAALTRMALHHGLNWILERLSKP